MKRSQYALYAVAIALIAVAVALLMRPPASLATNKLGDPQLAERDMALASALQSSRVAGGGQLRGEPQQVRGQLMTIGEAYKVMDPTGGMRLPFPDDQPVWLFALRGDWGNLDGRSYGQGLVLVNGRTNEVISTLTIPTDGVRELSELPPIDLAALTRLPAPAVSPASITPWPTVIYEIIPGPTVGPLPTGYLKPEPTIERPIQPTIVAPNDTPGIVPPPYPNPASKP